MSALYGLERDEGYGTAEQLAMLAWFGPMHVTPALIGPERCWSVGSWGLALDRLWRLRNEIGMERQRRVTAAR